RARNASRFFSRASIPLGVTLPASMAVAQPRRVETTRPNFASVHQRVLAEHTPPSVLIDHQSNIVHMTAGMGQFLRHVAGEPSRNLVNLVEPELRLELRTALLHAMQTGNSVETRRVRVEQNGRPCFVNMTARPFFDVNTSTDFVLVMFQKVEQITDGQAAGAENMHQDAVLSGLEQELDRARTQLQEIIEHSETSNEELKASNEELQAINEELRSATEELETSKEELQSVNEELITVNYELKSKVEETSKVNDDLHNLIASTNLATIFVDRGMRIKRYTPQTCDLFNLIPSDVGRPLNDITHKLDYPGLAQDAASSFEHLRAVEREVASQDGRWFIARLLPYRTGQDRIDGAVLTFIDITKRRQAEERARAGEERMRLVAASTKDYAIITTDKEGRITSFNSGAERIFGYSEEEVLGQPDAIIFTPEDRAARAPENEKLRARTEGRAEDERWHLRKDGSRLYCSGVVTPLHNGEFYGYAKIGRDLTGRLELERKNADRLVHEQSQREQAQSDSAQKDEFLAIMSHELKHPLNLIHMNAELLMRLPVVRNAPQMAKAVSMIRSSAISQAKIINDLLDLSRARTGKMELARDTINLDNLVRDIVDIVAQDNTGAAVSFSADTEAGALLAYADPVRIEQVVWNLLTNALKFTPADGAVQVTLAHEDNCVRLQVRDNGQGIKPEYLHTIFDIFGQGTASIQRGAKGLGIGLALVRQIVELHGGRVQAASDGPGTGACFTVWLPVAAAPAPQQNAHAGHDDMPLSGVRILIIDDSDEGLEAFETLLQMTGAEVRATTDGHRALAILDEQRFDVIISDLAMPQMDGYTLMREIRKRPDCLQIATLAMTGLGRQSDIERALAAGFTGHLSKPIDFDEMIGAIKRLLSGAAQRETPQGPIT
ncbi:MAG: PAS domain-containing protein, partial [Gammaproteobacteria bacterium]